MSSQREKPKVKEEDAAIVRFLPRTPSNEATVITSTFIHRLEIKDPKYDLTSYGIFMKDLPRRLGTSAALDASVSAFLSAYLSVPSRQQQPEALVKYGNALKSLRDSLQDPVESGSINTLCAIYLIMVCQVCSSLVGECDPGSTD